MLRIHLFGGLSLYWDEEPLPPIQTTLARSLLAYLVLNRCRGHNRAVLARIFWPEANEKQARRCLRQALWRIARVVNGLPRGPYLLREGDTVAFNTALPHWVDVEEFESLSYGDIPAMTRALSLYRGPLLPEVFGDWVLVDREKLHERWLALLERLALKAQYHNDIGGFYVRYPQGWQYSESEAQVLFAESEEGLAAKDGEAFQVAINSWPLIVFQERFGLTEKATPADYPRMMATSMQWQATEPRSLEVAGYLAAVMDVDNPDHEPPYKSLHLLGNDPSGAVEGPLLAVYGDARQRLVLTRRRNPRQAQEARDRVAVAPAGPGHPARFGEALQWPCFQRQRQGRS